MCASKRSRLELSARGRATARGSACALSLLFSILCCAPAHAEALRLLRITPSGDNLAAENQIVLHFDRAMVPLGRMERTAEEVPVRIAPEVDCQWRWLDAQALACNLPPPQRLQAATRYRVSVSTGFQALDGARLPQAIEHVFVTERPRLAFAYLQHWRGPGEPVVRARFHQPVTAAAIQDSVRFGNVPAQAEPEVEDAETPFYTPEGEARRSWWLRPERALPLDRGYSFHLEPGLRSVSGREPSVAAQSEFDFDTFPDLRLLGLECYSNETLRMLNASGSTDDCAPLEGVGIAFSAPVSAQTLKPLLRITPSPSPAAADAAFDPWAGHDEEALPGGLHKRGAHYSLRLPFQLAAETEYRIEIAAGLTDKFGRRLVEPQVLRFRTGARLPRFVFEHDHAVIESGLDSEVPAIVTNLDRIQVQFDRLTSAGLQTGQQQAIAVAPVRNLAFALPLDVRGLLGAASGAVRGGLLTEPSTGSTPREFFAAVTPWQVHAKLGHSNLLLWVTAMVDGRAVADAEVAVLDQFGGGLKASARSDANGIAVLPGAAELDPKLERVWGQKPGPLWLRVQRGDELAVMPLASEFIVDTWRASREQIYGWRRERHGHLKAWGTTAQGVYRAGDRVQYKLYLRDDAGRSLAPAPVAEYALKVVDPAGSLVHERKAQRLSEFGALHGEFSLSERAAVGWYRFLLTPAFAADLELEPLRVLVSDFVPAPFRVRAELRAAQAAPQQTLDAVIAATLHGGGAFANAPARVNARIQNEALQPSHPLAARYRYDTVVAGGRAFDTVLTRDARLDAHGEWALQLNAANAGVLHGRLILEGSVQDDRGRSIAAQTSVPYFGRDRYVGLHLPDWMARSGQPSRVELLVIDAKGQPQAGAPYYVRIERKQTRGARVKGAGNAYITRYVREWQRIATCQGRSRAEGMECAYTPETAGEYRVIAMVQDRQGRLHETQQWLYVQGPQDVLWEETPDYSLDVRLDKAEYREGQTAKLFVKNPFPGARALVTVERYGVLDHWVQTLDDHTPVIRIPVKPEYLPGAYVSVVVMSPRVEAPVKDGVDLGKPTFRMGYTTLSVHDPYREIAVEVKPEHARYKPGERVRIDLRAKPRHPQAGEPIELAVAVLDEAVFDLIQAGTAYFDPLKGFTSLEPLDLANYAMLTRLVGRQKFEKKGANAGGDGGADLALRSVEKFVAYWNPALKTDAHGAAAIEFVLPDNLTGWRVLALAVTPSDRMGLGQGKLAVSKLTELRPAMPNQVAPGDRFDAGFTVLNRDQKARSLTLELAVSGGASAQRSELVELQPFERRTLLLPVQVTGESPLRFSASASDALDRDALAHVVAVKPRRLSQVAADYSSLVAGDALEQTLRLPETAERGELRVRVAPTVIGNLGGAFAYLRDYPYDCWEQQLSRAVMAAQYLKLQSRIPAPEAWSEAATLPQQTLQRAADFQAPAGGMGFWLPQDTHQSPYLSAFTALAFGWLRELGYEPPAAVSDKLNAYLQTLLKDERPQRGFESAEARAQVRAVALAALAQQGLLKPDELRRYAGQLPRMGLFGQSLYLQAASQVPGAQGLSGPALDQVLARGQLSAGRLLLAEDDDGAGAAPLASELRSNCAALSALMAVQARREDAALTELPTRLVRAITQARGPRVHWQNTQENLYCSRALIAYADRYEGDEVRLTARASLDAVALGSVEIARGRSAMLSRNLIASDAGQDRMLTVATTGQGRAYIDTTLRYVERVAAQQPVSAGFGLERRYEVFRDGQWQALSAPLRVRRGERIKVELEVRAPGRMSYVVVDDPVPGGVEPINPDLANAALTDAPVDLAAGAYPVPFYHRELRFDGVRHYADEIGEGRYTLSWIGQAVATGEFAVDAPRVEQMYDPDVYATGSPQRLIVEEMP